MKSHLTIIYIIQLRWFLEDSFNMYKFYSRDDKVVYLLTLYRYSFSKYILVMIKDGKQLNFGLILQDASRYHMHNT